MYMYMCVCVYDRLCYGHFKTPYLQRIQLLFLGARGCPIRRRAAWRLDLPILRRPSYPGPHAVQGIRGDAHREGGGAHAAQGALRHVSSHLRIRTMIIENLL